jgi:hypothetical protein
VTPATQAQAAADDAAANGRIQQGGGAYGPYTCIQGYYTCVIPAVRSEAAYDNSQAASRVASLHLWVSDWILGELTPYVQVNGDQFNSGSVLVEVRRSSDGSVMWEQLVATGPHSGLPGAAFSVQTSARDCSGTPSTTYGYYVIAQDVASGRWSAELPIHSYCSLAPRPLNRVELFRLSRLVSVVRLVIHVDAPAGAVIRPCQVLASTWRRAPSTIGVVEDRKCRLSLSCWRGSPFSAVYFRRWSPQHLSPLRHRYLAAALVCQS